MHELKTPQRPTIFDDDLTREDLAEMEMMIEANARAGDSEAYAFTCLDPYEEGYASYEGRLSFDAWKTEAQAIERGEIQFELAPVSAQAVSDSDEIPF